MEPLADGPMDLNPDVRQLDALLNEALNEALDGVPVESRVEAQVLMPAKEKLTIRLAPVDALERLRESDSDKSLLDAAMWALIGALLGTGANIPISSQLPTSAGWVALVALGVACVGVLILRARFARRTKRIRDEFYKREGSSA